MRCCFVTVMGQVLEDTFQRSLDGAVHGKV